MLFFWLGHIVTWVNWSHHVMLYHATVSILWHEFIGLIMSCYIMLSAYCDMSWLVSSCHAISCHCRMTWTGLRPPRGHSEGASVSSIYFFVQSIGRCRWTCWHRTCVSWVEWSLELRFPQLADAEGPWRRIARCIWDFRWHVDARAFPTVAKNDCGVGMLGMSDISLSRLSCCGFGMLGMSDISLSRLSCLNMSWASWH